MPNDKIYSELIGSLVKTKYDANLLLGEIDVLERSLFKIGEEDFEHTLNSKVRARTAYAINKVIAGGPKEETLKNLRSHISSLVFIGITIAFEPTMEIISRIHSWVSANVGKEVALDLALDKSILGGAIIEYKGKIFKSTLISKVDQYFLENKDVNV